MIECSDSYIYYKRKKCKLTRKKFLAFFIIFCVIALLAFYYKQVICLNLITINNEYAKKCCSKSVNNVVLFSLNDKVKYDDLVNIEKNSVGDIVLLTANSHKINTLAHEIVKNSTLILDNELSKGVPIPIMAFSGIEALSGYGKVINVKFFSVSSISCEFNSRFDSMGINQTLHSIYIDVICKVKINLPFDESTIECVNSVLVSESVLLGKVPDALINGKIFS